MAGRRRSIHAQKLSHPVFSVRMDVGPPFVLISSEAGRLYLDLVGDAHDLFVAAGSF